MTKDDKIIVSEKALAEATAWHAQNNQAVTTEEDLIALTEWLEADEQHVLAYDMVEEALMKVEDFSSELASEFDETDEPSAQMLAPNVVNTDASFWQRKKALVVQVAAVAAVILVAFVGLGGVSNFMPAETVAHYASVAGKPRTIQLADGSTINLNVNSELSVTMREQSREVALLKGEAVFDVAKDPSRPFFVKMGETQVRVVGTVFNVLRHAGKVTVTVSEGIVEVTPDAAEATSSLAFTERLTKGQKLLHTEGEPTVYVTEADTELELSWLSGYLSYENESLAKVSADLERYFGVKIEVKEAARDLLFSGVIHTDKLSEGLTLLQGSLPISITRMSHLVVIDKK